MRADARTAAPLQGLLLASAFNNPGFQEVQGQLDGRRQVFRLLDDLVFHLGMNGDERAPPDSRSQVHIVVPKGSETDFFSVPWFLWPILPPTGPGMRAAALHDFLCRSAHCSRFYADTHLREGLYQLGISAWRRIPVYYAVRFYGAFFAKRKRPVRGGGNANL